VPREITCPACRSAYKIPEHLQGKPVRITCKKCDKVLTVAAGNGKPISRTRPERDDDEPVVRRPKSGKSRRREPEEKSSAFLITMIVLGILLLGGGGVGAYFLLRNKDESVPVVQNDIKIPELPGNLDQQKLDDAMRDLAKQVDDASKKTDGLFPKKEIPPVTDPLKDALTKDGPVKEPPMKEPPKEDPKKETPPPAPTLYTLKDQPTPPVNLTLEQPAHHIALLPDGNSAVLAVDDTLPDTRFLLVIELPSGKVMKKIPTRDLHVNSLALTPDGKTAIIGGTDDRFNAPDKISIRLINLETGTETSNIKSLKLPVNTLALSRDGKLLAIGEGNYPPPGNAIRVIDLKTGAELFAKEKTHTSRVRAVALTPDSKYVVSTGSDAGKSQCKVIVWDTAAGMEKHVWTGFPGTAEGLAVSGDGKWVAAAINAGTGGSLRVWNIETGEEKLALVGKSNGARNVIFGPEDKTVIGIFYDNSTRVFELMTGQEVGGVRGHSTAPSHLVLSSDNKRLVTGFFKEVRVWEFPDSLQSLARPGRPPLVTVVLDGKAAPTTDPSTPPKEEKPGKTIANATVESFVPDKHVQVMADGTSTRIGLRATSKFFDTTGTELAAAQSGKVLRPGNVVTIRSRMEFRDEVVVEMRLVREGASEQVLENAMVTEPGMKTAKFKADDKEVTVAYDSNIRLLNSDGQQVQGVPPNQFLGVFPPKPFRLTLKYAEGSGLPLLVEARQLVGSSVGAKPITATIQKAIVKRINIGKNYTSLALEEAGKPPLRINTSSETKAFNMDGKPVSLQEVLKEGTEVTATYVPNPVSSFVVEVRQTGIGEPPTTPMPEKKPRFEHKNVEVVRARGNSQVALKFGGKTPRIVTDGNTKAFDKAGQPIPVEFLLQNGFRVDVILEATGIANRYLVVEIRGR
jgi:WD40 repeat protein